jgi:hypothetical protein
LFLIWEIWLPRNSNIDHLVLFGKLQCPYIRAKRVQILGVLKAIFVVAEEEAVIFGSGRVGILASNNCILFSVKRPLIIGRAHCVNILVFGGKAPVVLKYVKARNIYARRVIIGELEVKEAVLAELCNIETLLRANRVTFVDPHLYIENLGDLGEVNYAYDIVDQV